MNVRVYRPLSRRARLIAAIIAAIILVEGDWGGGCSCDSTPRVSAIVTVGGVR